MSNQMHARRRDYRLQLMATVSAAVLLGVCTEAAASGEDRPSLWIELGWQFERNGGGQELYDPSFFNSISSNGFTSPLKLEKALPWSYGADGEISYRPENSDWVFSAAIRFGRSHGRRFVHEEKTGAGVPFKQYVGTHYLGENNATKDSFAQTKASNTEAHTILDFQAGRDVGIGIFGAGGTSVLSVGVRYAQLKLGSHSQIDARPDYYRFHNIKYGIFHYHTYSAKMDASRSFSGLGPAISWNASALLAGNPQNSEIAFDWGINASVLFGRQKTKVHRRTSAAYYCLAFKYTQCPEGVYHNPSSAHLMYFHSSQSADSRRARSVVVPNIGGFAALSLNWPNAKLSVGYRADMFFNVIDGGIDSRKSETRGFYGPFASISVGLGD